MDCQDLPSCFSTGTKNAVEDCFLIFERSVEPRAGIQPHLPDIGGFREKGLPKANLGFSFPDDLGMKAQGDPNVAGVLRQF